MKPKTIAQAWAEFRDTVIPVDAPQVQLQEGRKMFYAGALTLLNMQMEGLDPGADPTDADMDRMDGWADELAAFGKALQASGEIRERRRPDFGGAGDRIAARIDALVDAGLVAKGSATVRLSRGLPDVAAVTWEAIEAIAGEGVDFSLICWSGGRFQYIATADREDVAGALRRLLAGWEAGMPDVAAHDVL